MPAGQLSGAWSGFGQYLPENESIVAGTEEEIDVPFTWSADFAKAAADL